MDKAIITQKDEDIKADDNGDEEKARGFFHPLLIYWIYKCFLTSTLTQLLPTTKDKFKLSLFQTILNPLDLEFKTWLHTRIYLRFLLALLLLILFVLYYNITRYWIVEENPHNCLITMNLRPHQTVVYVQAA